MRETNVGTLRRELGLTQRELANHAGVSTQSIMRAEQGLHPTLSGGIAKALSELGNTDEAIIRRDYKRTRAWNIKQFSLDLTSSDNYELCRKEALTHTREYAQYNPTSSPTKYWREFIFSFFGIPLSGIKFCTYTGLHSAVLSNVENGKVTWRESKAFQRVLSEVLNCSEFEIALLGKLHDEFYLMVSKRTGDTHD